LWFALGWRALVFNRATLLGWFAAALLLGA
jgi:hypothetical protein